MLEIVRFSGDQRPITICPGMSFCQSGISQILKNAAVLVPLGKIEPIHQG